ncbi:MAG: helix-hairpin-helix domain-containing protein [Chloroflexales bacterium]
MFRPRRLIWLVIVSGMGYLAWRWRQDQATVLPTSAPSMSPSLSPARKTAASPDSASGPADSPRRIVTRVHRGAPPVSLIPAAPAVNAKPREEAPVPAEAPEAPVPAEAPEAPEAPVPAEAPEAPVPAKDPVLAEAPAEQAPVNVVNINTAELQTLIDIPGIGRSRATRIVAYRDQHGPFATVDALVNVQGIGLDNINKFRHLITA